MKPIVLLVIVFGFTVTSVIKSQNENVFQYLKKYVGEYKSSEAIEDSKLNPILKKMMGKEYTHLLQNVSVTGQVDLISGSLVIAGNAPHMGGEEMAIINVDLYTGIIRVGIYSKGKITIYSDKDNYAKYIDKNKYEHLPVSILDWIAVCNSNFVFRTIQPKNVTIK